ncbi:hypothetical protein PENSPDRAFT_753717 [Peniophora sp. CONT]|nr:hypothetical protein PENSPDRAFT_753717 [Peniophora sp. CONT]
MSQDGIIDLTGESSSPAPLASNGPMHTLPTQERSNAIIDLSEPPEAVGSRPDAGSSERAGPSVHTRSTTPIETPVSVTGSLAHVPPVEQHAVATPHSSTATIEISDGSNTSPSAPVTEDTVADEQVLLMLVGLVGAGKSTFADALEREFPLFRRCCQDEMGDRRAVENAARRTLQEGHSVCIDRTNLDRTQRSHWLNIAHEQNVPVRIVFFDTPYNVCAERLQRRRNHPTLHDAQTAISVLRRFAGSFEPPHPSEGHDSLLRLTPSDHASSDYSRDDIIQVLRRARDASAELDPRQRPITNFFRGGGSGRGGHAYSGGSGTYRGRGTGEYRGNAYSGRGRGGGAYPANRARGTYPYSGSAPGSWRSRASSGYGNRGGWAGRGVPLSSPHGSGGGGSSAHDPAYSGGQGSYRTRGGDSGRGGRAGAAAGSGRGAWRGAGTTADPLELD